LAAEKRPDDLMVLEEALAQGSFQQVSAAVEILSVSSLWHPPWWAKALKPDTIRQRVLKEQGIVNKGESSRKRGLSENSMVNPRKKIRKPSDAYMERREQKDADIVTNSF
jgi:hypothetical protein